MVLSAGLSILLAAAAAPPARAFAERLPVMDGVENAGRVAPGIYRGSQPTERGLDSLKALGVRTVVNLRHRHGGAEARGCRARGLDYVRLATESSDAPPDADVRRFLAIVTDPARRPVYFHCWRGKDRTGVMCAAYRLAVHGWSRDEALAEMEAYGFYKGWRDLRAYVEGLPARLPQIWSPPDLPPSGPAPPAE